MTMYQKEFSYLNDNDHEVVYHDNDVDFFLSTQAATLDVLPYDDDDDDDDKNGDIDDFFHKEWVGKLPKSSIRLIPKKCNLYGIDLDDPDSWIRCLDLKEDKS